MGATTIALVAVAAVSVGTTIYSAVSASDSQGESSDYSKEIYATQRADLQASKEEEKARQAAEEERLAPWRKAQEEAMQEYKTYAENPEISPYTQLRLEEEEKAINAELAAKGLLFSGPAAELRQKARERIVAEETDKAKSALATVMNAAPPGEGLMPGTSEYDAMLAGLKPVDFGTSGASTLGQGLTNASSQLVGATSGYVYNQQLLDALNKTKGLYSNLPYTSSSTSTGTGLGIDTNVWGNYTKTSGYQNLLTL